MATSAQAKKNRCYYEVLGVPKKSSEQEIKAAYRKMALKYHPDRNQDNKVAAEEAFKEVSEAYAVLGDPQKRANYDNYGAAGSQGMPFEGNGGFQGQTMSREQAEAIFKSLFGGMGGMGGMDLGKILSQHGFAFRAGSMGGTSQQSEQSMFRNGKGQMVMRTRTRVRMPDGTIKEHVTERILGGR